MADSGVIYGATGSFKTTAVAHFANYIAEVTGKATLLLSADGSGWKPCMEEVVSGMIRPYRCDSSTIPLPIIRKISQGYWPLNVEEPDVSQLNFTRINWDDVGGIAVEGLTSISQMLMRHLADRAIKTGEEATSKFSQPIMVEGRITMETFAGNSKAHFGFVQNNLYALVMNFTSLPVGYVLFTAHESKGEEDDRTSVYGPGIAGKKATPLVGGWVGDLIHAQDYAVSRIVRAPDPQDPTKLVDTSIVDTICRFHIKKHPDPVTGIMFPAKARVTHSKVAELDRLYPAGFFVPTPDNGFDDYLRTIDRLTRDAVENSQALKGWRERADALLGRGKPIAVVGGTK